MDSHRISLYSLRLVLAFLMMSFLGCSKNKENNLPDGFSSLPTEQKMEYLMARMPVDSVARYICDAAMGKIYNVRIELSQAMVYAYEHYGDDDLVKFQMEIEEYQASLPLHEKVKFSKFSTIEDPDKLSYDLGLSYVGEIRENAKDAKEVKQDLDLLRKECQTDPEFYKRFMKGFKIALEYDRNHDLDDKIYKQFITYPDSI